MKNEINKERSFKEIPENTGEVLDNRNPDGTFKKGMSGNPAGKPLGAKNFNTLFEDGLKHIAKLNGKEPDDFDMEIIAKAIELARKGDFRFYKDLNDRRFGKSQDKIDHTTNGENLGGTFNVIFDNGRKQSE